MKVFICFMSGFFLWYSGLFLVNPPQIIAQETEAKNRETTKALLKQMIPDHLPPGIAPEKLPEPNSLGAKHLQKYCTQCHALPDPKQHTTQEWPGVTSRMNQNMQFMHKPLIQPEEEALIVQFLQLSATQ